MPLSEPLKQKIKFHMGYPLVNEGQAYAAGIPISIQPMYLIIGAMERVPEAAIPFIEGCIGALDKNLELQRTLGIKALIASKLEDLDLREDYLKDLRREYRAEQERLGQLLNCPINAGGVDVDCGVGNVTVC
jgi:hypothetical protein